MSDETWIVGVYYAVLVWLVVYAVHRFHLIRLVRRAQSRPQSVPDPAEWPAVAVQLPVFNEPAVVRRLIRAAAQLDYPGRLEIQVLDDSTDETTAIIEQELCRLADPRIRHLRRGSRHGYKAGALAYGLARTDAPYIAVLDADFVVPQDFLLRAIPHFDGARIGMVQARWGHLNRDASLLTRLQAIYLDAHFAVESAARHAHGLFFNFNGTAGIWRREAIEDAGGWSAGTVTEDLDLSYRAQKRGWSFVFLRDLEVPAELPETMTAFHGQQFRWAKGSLQTARLHAWSLLWERRPWPVRLESLFHLTNNSAYLLTLVLALLLVPSMMIRYAERTTWILAIDVAMFLVSSSSLVMFYREGQRQIGRAGPSISELLWLVPFGVGLCVTNARAALEGLVLRGGIFNRTFKRGGAGRVRTETRPAPPWTETILAFYFAFATVAIVMELIFVPLPFVVLFLLGFGTKVWFGWRESLRDVEE